MGGRADTGFAPLLSGCAQGRCTRLARKRAGGVLGCGAHRTLVTLSLFIDNFGIMPTPTAGHASCHQAASVGGRARAGAVQGGGGDAGGAAPPKVRCAVIPARGKQCSCANVVQQFGKDGWPVGCALTMLAQHRLSSICASRTTVCPSAALTLLPPAASYCLWVVAPSRTWPLYPSESGCQRAYSSVGSRAKASQVSCRSLFQGQAGTCTPPMPPSPHTDLPPHLAGSCTAARSSSCCAAAATSRWNPSCSARVGATYRLALAC